MANSFVFIYVINSIFNKNEGTIVHKMYKINSLYLEHVVKLIQYPLTSKTFLKFIFME